MKKSEAPEGKNAAKARIWILGLLVFGLIALGLSFWVQSRQQKSLINQFQMAQVEHITGTVWILSSGFEKKRKVDRTSPLNPGESIETEDTGEARLLFDNGASLRLFPDSLALVDRNEISDAVQDTLVIQRGEIRVEEPGRTGEFYISKNGTRVPGADYHKLALANEPVDKPVASADPYSTLAEGGLSEEEIVGILRAQRSNFMKCYTALLQKQPDAKGDMSLNFTIENTGKVGLIEINSIALKDEELEKCIGSVLSRVQFRAFAGTPISTFFPLTLE